jgi:tetratricopeptide (TPR) repeat protein
MRYLTAFLALILLLLFLFRCGGDPITNGDKAFQDGKYNEALKFYSDAQKEKPDDQSLKEKIALTYAKKGESLYNRSKNLNSFVGNMEKAGNFITDENQSETFKKEYSKVLFTLAEAYHKSKAENPIQEEQFFTKTLDYLDQALLYDYENEKADSLMASIRKTNFQKMFEKGVQFFKQAQKEKNNGDLYLSAELYMNRAVSFDPQNKEAEQYLKKIRQQTLKILDLNKDFPIAIIAMKRTASHLLIDFSGLNNLGKAFEFDPSKLVVVDMDNNEYFFDPAETEKYDRALSKPVTVDNRKQVEGNIAFKIPKSINTQFIRYDLGESKTSKKYLP